MIIDKKINYLQALKIPFRAAPFETTIQQIDNLILFAIAPLNILVTAYFINTALDVVTHGYDASSIILPLIVMVVFRLYGYIREPLMELLTTRLIIKLRLALYVPFLEKRARLEFKHLENTETADLLDRVWQNPEGQISDMLGNLQNFLLMLGQITSYAIILLVNAPLAGAILIFLSIPVCIIAKKAGKANYQAQRETTLDTRYSWNIAWVLTARETVSERNMFGYFDHLNQKYEHHFEASRKHMLKIKSLWFISSSASSILVGLLSAAGLFIMIPSVASGDLSVGLFISLQVALFKAVQQIGWRLSWYFQLFAFHREYLMDVNQFLQLSEAPEADALPVASTPEFERLEFQNVSFAYPGTEKLILDNLSLVMEKGKHYSFVGINGAGKTTITKLMTRLYDDYTGEILLNGKSLREWSLPEIKACFCALFQDFAQYDITVAENVAVGKINGATCSEINHALNLSGFDKKAKELKDGKDTLLGKTHEGSVDLSGGQWQRLAFARAIINPAPVKILDEPTSALDPVAESELYAQFESISRGFTTIFISHRLASAKLADTIFVLDKGKMAEQGSHEELMSANGIYAEMFESQQSWYA